MIFDVLWYLLDTTLPIGSDRGTVVTHLKKSYLATYFRVFFATYVCARTFYNFSVHWTQAV